MKEDEWYLTPIKQNCLVEISYDEWNKPYYKEMLKMCDKSRFIVMPIRKSKSKRVQKKFNKKYGYRIFARTDGVVEKFNEESTTYSTKNVFDTLYLVHERC